MTGLPPRFTTDLADALSLGSTPTPSPRPSSRRWDDPPEDAPPPQPSKDDGGPLKKIPTTTLLLVGPIPVPAAGPAEIVHLAFSAGGLGNRSPALLLAAVPRVFFSNSAADNHATLTSAPCHSLHFWTVAAPHAPRPHAPKGLKKLTAACSFTIGGGGINGLPAFRRRGAAAAQGWDADAWLAAARFELTPKEIGSEPRLAAYDVGRGVAGMEGLMPGSPIRAPMAWSGDRIAGVSVHDARRVVVLRTEVAGAGTVRMRVERMLAGHLDEVKLVGFLPTGEVVSAGVDGYVRVTSVVDGRMVRRISVAARGPPGLMEVAPDGAVVVTVWGREVVVWEMASGRVSGYNLDAVRSYECWPLCVSPDCRYLVCRTEDGIDVGDALTGKFMGEFLWRGPLILITAAAVNEEATLLAVGHSNGAIEMFEMVTG